MKYLSDIVAVLSVIAAILAWVAKLKWSKEFASAKNETIKAKEAEIKLLNSHVEVLRDLSSATMIDNFRATKAQLEEFNGVLQEEIEEKKINLVEKEAEIGRLESQSVKVEGARAELEGERDALRAKMKELEETSEEASFLQKQYVLPEKSFSDVIQRYDEFAKKVSISLPGLAGLTELKGLAGLTEITGLAEISRLGSLHNSLSATLTADGEKNEGDDVSEE